MLPHKNKDVIKKYEEICKLYEKQFSENLKELGKLFDNNNHDFMRILESMPDDFGGPSVYFHLEAIEKARGDSNEFLELDHRKMIYAVLPAWGMHRMTKTTKIVEFEGVEGFEERIKDAKALIEPFRNTKLEYVYKSLEKGKEEVERIVSLISHLQINETGEDDNDSSRKTFLVSSSKTLHHILPDLIPPIDRAYSLKFMKKKPNEFAKYSGISINQNGEECLAKLFIVKMCEFIYATPGRCVKMNKMVKDDKNKNGGRGRFNTSLPKLFDNLIIAFVKMSKEKYPKGKK